MVSTRSVLNGVIGDYLVATDNELATPMTLLRRPDQPLDSSQLAEELQRKAKQLGTNDPLPICILIHGLVSDEHCWTFPTVTTTDKNKPHTDLDGLDYGTLLERDIPGWTSLYLRYNTGLHISNNGKQLNELLEALVVQLQTSARMPPLQVTLICHSMGGLVARSATQYALRHAAAWIRAASRIIFLGTPHQGSYWEYAGQFLTCALDYVPFSATKVAARLAKLRSHGIQDLRYGYTLEEDWNSNHPQEEGSTSWSQWIQDKRQPGQERLLEWVSYHAVTGTVMSDPQHPISLLLGDGLVSKASAEGRSAHPGYSLTFPSMREFPGIHHNSLQRSWEVYEQLREWIMLAEQPVAPKFDWSNIPCRATTDRVLYNEKKEPECTDSGFVLLDNDDTMITTTDKNRDHILSITTKNTKRSGRFAQYRGATALVQDAVDAGVTAVEHVQTEITDEVYRAVTYMTPSLAAPIVARVHGIHTGIVSSIYSSVRYVNYGTGETVKCAFQTMDSIESLRGRMSRYLGYNNSSSR